MCGVYQLLSAQAEEIVEQTDDELLRRCQAGDDAALSELVRRFDGRVFRLAFRVLQDAARAEDAAADAFARVWERSPTWREESGAGTWIHQVALRVVLDHHRRRQRWWRFWDRAENAQQPEDPADAFSQNETRMELQEQLAVAMQQLSAEDRALVQFYYFEQQSLAEIAKIMNVSRDALKMRLSRARQRLRSILEDNRDSG